MNDSFLASTCYLDTNIFIYLFDQNSPDKRKIANDLYSSFLKSGRGVVSLLVVAEWRNVMIRKYNCVVNEQIRMEFLQLFEVWKPVQPTLQTIIGAENLAKRYSISPFDSIHLQIALDSSCEYFMSEDLQDGLNIDRRLTIINPFKK